MKAGHAARDFMTDLLAPLSRTRRPADVLRAGAWLIGLVLLLHPIFFVIYRLSVFDTVPRDDYARFLLWTVGNTEGVLPSSPYCYRVLSMVLAVPFYWVVPAVRLTNIPANLSAAYLHATAALSALAFVAWIAGAMVIYAIAVTRCALSRRDGMLAATLLFALGLLGQIASIDTVTIALVALGVALVDRPRIFAGFVLISIVANEKIALVLAIWLTIRCVLSRQDRAAFGLQCAAALLAVVAYLALIKLVPMPGNSYQTDPDSFPVTLRENLAAYASGRGLLLNVLPTAILAAIGCFGHIFWRHRRSGLFRAADLLVIPAMLCVALVLTHLFQAGRIVMHAAPLFVIPAVAAFGSWLDESPRPN
jgi:hypothetical protein